MGYFHLVSHYERQILEKPAAEAPEKPKPSLWVVAIQETNDKGSKDFLFSLLSFDDFFEAEDYVSQKNSKVRDSAEWLYCCLLADIVPLPAGHVYVDDFSEQNKDQPQK